jgi:hypothetical protein
MINMERERRDENNDNDVERRKLDSEETIKSIISEIKMENSVRRWGREET